MSREYEEDRPTDETSLLERPGVDVPEIDDPLEAALGWIWEHRESLLERYAGSWIAVDDEGSVRATASSAAELHSSLRDRGLIGQALPYHIVPEAFMPTAGI